VELLTIQDISISIFNLKITKFTGVFSALPPIYKETLSVFQKITIIIDKFWQKLRVQDMLGWKTSVDMKR
jgi:hypothetical protein